MRAAALRSQIEQTLSRRCDAALTPRLRRAPDRLPTGIAALDRLLHGGLPRGAITELVGPASSGHTTLALSFAAARLQEEQVAAWIDASDTLDPASAASLGVSLERLLWVRCGSESTGRRTRQEMNHARQNPPAALDARCVSVDRSLSVPSQGGGGGSPHPRSEARGLPEALEGLLGEAPPPTRMHVGGNRGLLPPRRRDKSIATPGVANRTLSATSAAAVDRSAYTAAGQIGLHHGTAGNTAAQDLYRRSPYREEQAASDRLPARRGEHLAHRPAAASSWSARCAEPQSRASRTIPAAASNATVCQGPCTGPAPPAHPATPGEKPRSANEAATLFFKQLSEDAGSPPRHTPASVSLRGIDQALRAADLLLQSSGFGVVVLDLASLPPELVWRIPLSTWFRYRAAAERTRTCLLLLTQHACARSSAELVLDLHAGRFTSSGCVVTGVHWSASIARERFAPAASTTTNVVSIRKPPQPEHPGCWSGAAPWAPPSVAPHAAEEDAPSNGCALPAGTSPHAVTDTPDPFHEDRRLATFPRRSA